VFPGPADSFARIHDALLLPVCPDEADLPDPDLIIHLQVSRYGLHLQIDCVSE
jgi:hypothetical protein